MNQWYIAGGDSGYYWAEQILSFSWLPQVYRVDRGFGWFRLQTLWFDYPFRLFVKLLYVLGLSWWWIEKILWAGVLVLGVYASYRLATYVFKRPGLGIIASIIYTTNTYALLLFGGGQLGVALGYSLAPLVLLKFITTIDQLSITNYEMKKQNNALSAIRYQDTRQSIINGLWFALLVCCDLRLAYLVMGAIGLYIVLRITNYELRIKNVILLIVYAVIIPLVVAGIFHLFWILPIVVVGAGGALSGEEFTNAGMLQFLSVADFSHALSLLHPNWPENLFGKVYFLQPEFLILPILAFASLLFINYQITNYELPASPAGGRIRKNNSLSAIRYQSIYIVYFAILVLLGAFFAKGVNPPFGGVYEWFFSYVPGFVMFRDPTKFYLYVAMGYSVLIPFTLYVFVNNELRIADWNKNIIRYTLSVIIAIAFLGYWCFTIRQVFLGQMTGNFKPLYLNEEFVRLKNMLAEDKEPSRTLWIPTFEAFGFFSETHPSLSGETLFQNASASAVIDLMAKPTFQDTIQKAGVKYVIIPIDEEKRMFLSDYQWDGQKRDDLVRALAATNLIPHPEFKKLAVFENQNVVFSQEIPAYVERQQEWSRRGFIISTTVVLALVGIIMVVKR